ncbi:MAG TPA: DUF6702 family protein [Salinimicrobium sp.]|nr:DUF6702 family protein [Salinimicrobium sp.]
MKKYLFLIFLLPLLSFTAIHKYYVSMTEIEFSKENNSLQIISRVFTDDMQKMLQTRYNEEIVLAKGMEHPAADKFLEKYVLDRIDISVNGTPKKLNFLGKEYDKDQLVLYIEIEEVPNVKAISVRNEMLTGLFPDQKNVVHVEVGEENKSLLLSRNHEKGQLSFKK